MGLESVDFVKAGSERLIDLARGVDEYIEAQRPGLAALAANSCDAASGRIVTLRFLLSPTRRVMLSMGLPESSVTLMDSGA